jgi:hypothetical protein
MTTKAVSAAVDEAAANHHVRGLLTLDDILGADDIRTEYVEVPEWGGTVRLRSLTGLERDRIVNASQKDENGPAFYARVVAASLIDDDGKNIADPSAAAKLVKKNAGALFRVWKACARLSGIGDDALDQAEQELKGVPTADSPGD